MATFYSNTNRGYRLRLDVTQTSQNVGANTSAISYTLKLESTTASFGAWGHTRSLSIDGTQVYSVNNQITIAGNSTLTLATGTRTISHNADGAKSISLVASFDANQRSGWVVTSALTINTSMALTTIPRYASITAFTASINDRTASLSWTADKTISQWRWSTNSGSSYSGWTTVNASSGSTSISVSPGSTYGFRIQVRSSASGLDTTSSTVSKTATKTPSTLTLSTTSQDVGSAITWTINESYDYTHQITYAFGNTSGYILGSNGVIPNTSTGTWTVPTALANQIPSATSGSGTIYVYTYYGSVHVGTKSYTFTAKVPNNTTWQPTVPSVTISDAGTRPAGITSYVQGKAKATVVSSSTAQGGASISSYQVTVSGIGTYYGSNITSGFLTNSGTVTITVRATDSRGYYREKSDTITVEAYSPPKLTTYTAMRAPNDQGTDLTTNIDFTISSVSSQNTKQYRIRYRPTGGTWVILVDSTEYYTRSTTHSETGALDANSSYEVEFYIKDSYASVTQTRNIGTAFQLMDFNASGRGMAIGKVSESDSFEVAIPAYLDGGLLNNGVRGARIQFNVGGDANTYYPVVIVPPLSAPDMVKLSVSRVFNEPAPNTWNNSTHKGGLTLTVFCTGYSTWSGNSSAYSVLEHAETYSTICSGIDVHTGNGLIFYLRGGGASYSVTGDCWLGTSVTVYLGGYTAPDGAVFSAMAYNQAKVNSSINAKRMGGGGTSSVSWNDILSKPSTFAPSAHNQAWSTITSQPATATRWPSWSEVTSKPSTFAPSSHTHTSAQLPNAMTALWSGNASTAGTRTMTSYSGYDFLIVLGFMDQGSSENLVSVTIPVATISTNARRYSLHLSYNTLNSYVHFSFPSATQFRIDVTYGNYVENIQWIYGVKIT